MDQTTLVPGSQDFISLLKRKIYCGKYNELYQRKLLMKRRKKGKKKTSRQGR
jgi:hypothetical protein